MSFKSFNLFALSLFILVACGGGGGSSPYGSSSETTDSGGSSCTPSTTNLCITVNTDRKYVVQNSSSTGVAQKTLTLNTGTYVFDQSGLTNATHPLRISSTNDGTHGGGSAYTSGVTVSGTPGTDGKTTLVIDSSTPSTLYYYCSSHSGMGGTINIVLGESSAQVEFTETTTNTAN
ncbi:MAG: hypothetical protein ACJ0BD_06090 [Gammaproteobacteria bacterium]